MQNDTAETVKLSLGHEHVTCFYVRSESNFKFVRVIYDINILKRYEMYIRRGNSRSFWFNYPENRGKLADRKKITFYFTCFLFCNICPSDRYLGGMAK